MSRDERVPQPRRGLVWPGIAASAAFVALIALGTWQLERKQWKEALIATLTQRLLESPTPLPGKARWAELDQQRDEFRRVSLRVRFIHAQEALVYTAGSALRPDIAGPGYWVFTPARLDDGSVVMVDRGFIPQQNANPATRAQGQVEGAIEIVGALRWPEARSWFTPADESARNVWYTRDQLAIAAAKGISDAAPFFVDQEKPEPPGGLPRAGPLAIRLRNDHLQYALTWFGLAAVLVIAFAVWARGRRRGHG